MQSLYQCRQLNSKLENCGRCCSSPLFPRQSKALYLLCTQHVADKDVAEPDIFQILSCCFRLLLADLRQACVYCLTFVEDRETTKPR